MRFRAALPLALVLLVLPVALLPAAADPSVSQDWSRPVADRAGPAALQQTDDTPEPRAVTIEIALEADGDARFTVSTAFALDNETDREAFERLAEEFESARGDTDLGLSTFRRAAAAASNATGREMRIPDRSVDRNSTVENDTGVLLVSFTWTDFASVAGDEYRVGDAFNTTHGTWLPALRENQTLVVRPPRGYTLDSAPPVGFDNNVVRISGPRTLEPGFLEFVYEPRGPAPTTTSPGGTTTTGENPDEGFPLVLAGVFVIGLGVVVLGAYAFSRREREPVSEPDDSGVGAESAGPDGGSTAGAGADTDGGDDDQAGIDPELLSDEERVEYLLQQNGGRMKQANIVRETGWSNAKVSQLLSSMAEDDRVQKLRIGRENLIALPDEDIGEFES